MIKKCIYCNLSEADGIKLSKSDIIPDALCNRSLINNRVCKIKHNSEFSNSFESIVIGAFDFLRNKLGLKNKDKKIPQYKAKVRINDKLFTKKINRKENFFKGVAVSVDNIEGKTLFGPIQDFKSNKKFNSQELEEYSLNSLNMIEEVDLNISIFFKSEMLRLAAKIGYEWYCKILDLNGVSEERKEIIDFILNKNGSEGIVEIVNNKVMYNMLTPQLNLGTHSLCKYDSIDGNSYIIYSFFGLIYYKIKITKHNKICEDANLIEFYGIRYDGSETKVRLYGNSDFLFSSVDPKIAYDEMLDDIVDRYDELLSTELVSIENFKRHFDEVKKNVEKYSGDELYDSLIGFKDRKKLLAIMILNKIGENKDSLDYNKTFYENTRNLFYSNEFVQIDEEELYDQLKELFDNEKLIQNIEAGYSCLESLK